jgi:ubiquinone biosynthesis protein UbiJ
MHELLQSNPGLRSRFSREIVFPDYTTDELVRIAGKFAGDAEYDLTPEAGETMARVLAQAARGPSFGNARTARTLFEHTLNAHAARLGPRLETASLEELSTLTGDDVELAARALGQRIPDLDDRRGLLRRRR